MKERASRLCCLILGSLRPLNYVVIRYTILLLLYHPRNLIFIKNHKLALHHDGHLNIFLENDLYLDYKFLSYFISFEREEYNHFLDLVTCSITK